MKRNWTIKISIIIFLTIDLLLIILGLILISSRKEKLREDVENSFKSPMFVSYVTENTTNDYSEMIKMFDSDFKILDDSTIVDIGNKEREIFKENTLSNKVMWKDLMMFIKNIAGVSNFDPSIIENSYGVALIILLDKGGDSKCWQYVFEEILSFFISDQIQIISTALATIFGSLLLPTGLEGYNINLFNYDLNFVYEENGNIVEYDLSYGMTEEIWNGVEGENLGIKNWDYYECSDLFDTGSINLDIVNDGDLFFSFMLYFGFDRSDNTYFLLNKYIEKTKKLYYGKEYQTYIISENKTTMTWEYIKKEQNNIVDSPGESFLYSLYDNIEYWKYFDNALESDKINIGYEFKYVPNLYQESKLSFVDYNSTENYDYIWKKGQKETDFSNFLFLTQTYSPFLRSINYNNFIIDLSKLIVNDVKLSDLEKPNYE